jgi:HAD superfamily hydrolase (TIGR01509 family)
MELFVTTAGIPEDKVTKKLCEYYHIPYRESIVDEVFSEIQRVAPDFVRPYDGARELLVRLKEEDRTTVLCTNTSIRKVEGNFKACKIPLSLFDAVVTGEDVREGKPNPEIFLTGAGKISRAPKDCIVVEDSLIGIEAGRRAAWR